MAMSMSPLRWYFKEYEVSRSFKSGLVVEIMNILRLYENMEVFTSKNADRLNKLVDLVEDASDKHYLHGVFQAFLVSMTELKFENGSAPNIYNVEFPIDTLDRVQILVPLLNNTAALQEKTLTFTEILAQRKFN